MGFETRLVLAIAENITNVLMDHVKCGWQQKDWVKWLKEHCDPDNKTQTDDELLRLSRWSYQAEICPG